MASSLTATTVAPVAVPAGSSSAAVAVPAGTGAVGAANLQMVRMTHLLDQAHKALKILEDVGADLLAATTVTSDTAEHLSASLGERTSLEQLRVIAAMLTQIAEGSLTVVGNGHDALRSALIANFQVLIVQEQLHALGADGAYVDSQRRAG